MKHILCAIMSLLLFVACTSEEVTSSVQTGGNESTTPSITLDQNYLNFDKHSDVQTISFSSTMDWTAELINDRADGWCSISATSGTAGSRDIDVTVTENTSTDDRTASVIIKSGAISKTVRISQKQRDALTVTTSTFEVESTKGKIYIEVKANIDFEYTINGSAAEWISPIETRALKTTKLGFNIAENNTFSNREGTITIHSGNMQEVVTVYQKGNNDAILLSQNEFIISDEGEDIAIEVTSNLDVAIEMPDVDWITRNTSRAVSTNTYYFTIAENSAHQQREAYITFINREKNISERVKIIQAQKDAIVLAKSEYEMELEGGELDFDIQANVEVQVSIAADAKSWITHVTSRALETKTLHFDIAAYDGDDTREGVITLSGGGATQTVTIRQLSWQNLKDNKIYYTTSDANVVKPKESTTTWGGAKIMSHTYENGQGIITFNRNLTSIGDRAFYECKSLTSITILEGVTSIGERAFAGCYDLTSITIGNGVTSIGKEAFLGCPFTSITIPDSVTSIESGAFYGCSALTNITIPERVTSIGDRAFYECKSLTSITIPEGVTSIGERAFYFCESLTSITIPEGVTSIGDSAFRYCFSLTSIKIPDSVTSIEKETFYECSALEAFYGKYASEDNRCLIINGKLNSFAPAGLISYNIPDKVTSIGDRAFIFCSSLTSIKIPDSVTSIEKEAFYGCSALTNITIPERVTSIGNYAFYGCRALTNITIPERVTSIGDGAFSHCSALEAFYGKYASEDNRCLIINGKLNSFAPAGLISYNIPDKVTSIGNSAFSNCSSLTSITIPDSVTSIGGSAFYGCHALTSVYCKATTPPTLGGAVFGGNNTIYVPEESVDAYKSATNWSEYASAIVGYDF